MSPRAVSLRIPEGVRSAIAETASRARRDFSSVANEMLEEAVKMRRIPGIVFTDSPAGGRVARLAGTGLEVYEVIGAFRAVGQDWNRLQDAYHWLSEHQLRAALAYAEAYSGEIDREIDENERWDPDRVKTTYPMLRKPGS